MLNSIIKSFEIWSTAQTQKSMGRNRGIDNIKLHGINRLRELILELAVRGKLVAQDTNDEPANVLLKKIAKVKAQLIKESKIKKQEVLPEVGEDEKTFHLPDGWEWVRLGEVSEFINGFAFKSSDFNDNGVGIVKIGDIQNGEIITDSMSRVDENIVSGIDDSLKVNKNDLLIAMSGATTGKLGFNRTNEIFYINQRVGKIIPHCLNVSYLFFPLTTMIAENLAKSMGSAIPNLSTAQIKNIVFALPPLAEQHRIIAKVDELMALCDKLEQQQTYSLETHHLLVETFLKTLTEVADADELKVAWQRIEANFDILFTTEDSVDLLKQTILQLAVMGKLVPQDPKDEPASELLKQIAKEKARLVKEGKIRKQTPLPEITDDEKPFELPEGWMWVRLNDAIDVRDGTHDTPKDASGENTYPLVTSKNFDNGNIKFEEAKRISAEDHFEISKRSNVERFDILFSMIGGNLGNQVMVNNDRPFSIKNVALFKYYNKEYTSPFFIKKIMEHVAIDLQKIAIGGAQPFVPLGFLRNIVIPLPPLAEQHRIVSKVDELFSLCDTLKERIFESQEIKVKLADAVVEGAVKVKPAGKVIYSSREQLSIAAEP